MFISYRKTSKDVLELVEQSLDYDLVGSRVMFRFQDTQILDGISITESRGNVVILVATVASVHRLIFPHPMKLQRNVSALYPESGSKKIQLEWSILKYTFK